MKFIQALAMSGLIFGGAIGLSTAASAAPLANAPALHAADSGSLVIQVRGNKNKKGGRGGGGGRNAGHHGGGHHGGGNAAAIGAGIGLLGAFIAGQQDNAEAYDDDDAPRRRHHYRRQHCRHGTYVDHRGVERCEE